VATWDPYSIVAYGDSVWVDEDGSLLRIDKATNEIIANITAPGRGPVFICDEIDYK
jgi:hypothetical protein